MGKDGSGWIWTQGSAAGEDVGFVASYWGAVGNIDDYCTGCTRQCPIRSVVGKAVSSDVGTVGPIAEVAIRQELQLSVLWALVQHDGYDIVVWVHCLR